MHNEGILKFLNNLKQDIYKDIDTKDDEFIQRYNIRYVKKEYEEAINQLKQLKEDDAYCGFWFSKAFATLLSLKYLYSTKIFEDRFFNDFKDMISDEGNTSKTKH